MSTEREYIAKVVAEFEKIPDEHNVNPKLYTKILNVFNKQKNPTYTNGEITDTLKAIVLMMCKECTDYCDEKNYEQIQESMK